LFACETNKFIIIILLLLLVLNTGYRLHASYCHHTLRRWISVNRVPSTVRHFGHRGHCHKTLDARLLLGQGWRSHVIVASVHRSFCLWAGSLTNALTDVDQTWVTL